MKFILPAILFFSQFLFAHGHHDPDLKASAPLPGASIYQLDSKWKNQRGEEVQLTGLRGKPILMVMLFTKCETACPLIVEDLKEIVKDVEAKRVGKIDVAIFSLDSFRDTPESLSAFALKRKLPGHWGLYTSSADAVAELAAALGVRYKRLANGDFIHSNVVYFINAKGEIAGRKEGIKSPRAEFLKIVKGDF